MNDALIQPLVLLGLVALDIYLGWQIVRIHRSRCDTDFQRVVKLLLCVGLSGVLIFVAGGVLALGARLWGG